MLKNIHPPQQEFDDLRFQTGTSNMGAAGLVIPEKYFYSMNPASGAGWHRQYFTA